jgi:hypothetical protein
MAVLFVNENDLTPARSIGQLLAGALIGILTATVLHELSTSWVVLGPRPPAHRRAGAQPRAAQGPGHRLPGLLGRST